MTAIIEGCFGETRFTVISKLNVTFDDALAVCANEVKGSTLGRVGSQEEFDWVVLLVNIITPLQTAEHQTWVGIRVSFHTRVDVSCF